ncbi:MAG: hypothetical protein ACK56F_01575 [bacterium]
MSRYKFERIMRRRPHIQSTHCICNKKHQQSRKKSERQRSMDSSTYGFDYTDTTLSFCDILGRKVYSNFQ